jgi:hypothetical protein
LDKASLKKISKDRGVAFSGALAGYIITELIEMMLRSDFAAYLWIKNDDIFNPESFCGGNIPDVELLYKKDPAVKADRHPVPGQKLSPKIGYLILGMMLKNKTDDIKWKAGASMQGSGLILKMNGELEEMTVPVRIVINETADELMTPVKKEFVPFYDTSRTVPYLAAPAEEILAEELSVILKDMELIPELRPYERVYEILNAEAVDGRRTAELVAEYAKTAGIPHDMARADEIAGYADYPYMRKRWEKYVRAGRKESADWSEIAGYTGAFLVPVWRSVCKGELFFGDWMPGIGRFLD